MTFNIETATAEQITSVDDGNPERIFSRDHDKARSEYHFLLKKWHPDVNKHPAASDVSSKITILYDNAVLKIKSGDWIYSDRIEFQCADSLIRRAKYEVKRKFDFGELYYGGHLATYVYDKSHISVADAALRSLKTLSYDKGKDWEQYHKSLFPVVQHDFMTSDGRRVLVQKKDDGVYRLDDVLSVYGTLMPPEHVAWIMSRLYGIACFFEVSGSSFNAINPQTVFVSPKDHKLFLLDGWEFRTGYGEKVSRIPNFNYHFGSCRLRTKKQSNDASHDLASVRAVGRYLLGDSDGMSLVNSKLVPAPMARFLCGSGRKTAVEEFSEWKSNILPKSFGEPKFVKMNIGDKEVFEKKGG